MGSLKPIVGEKTFTGAAWLTIVFTCLVNLKGTMQYAISTHCELNANDSYPVSLHRNQVE